MWNLLANLMLNGLRGVIVKADVVVKRKLVQISQHTKTILVSTEMSFAVTMVRFGLNKMIKFLTSNVHTFNKLLTKPFIDKTHRLYNRSVLHCIKNCIHAFFVYYRLFITTKRVCVIGHLPLASTLLIVFNTYKQTKKNHFTFKKIYVSSWLTFVPEFKQYVSEIHMSDVTTCIFHRCVCQQKLDLLNIFMVYFLHNTLN